MADNVVKEILQYVIDTAQMEAGAQRAKKIEQEIADARGKGQDTGGLETKLATETAAHEKLTQKTGESRVSLERLLKSKRDMGDVVSLLGGRFQGLIGDVGGVIELFTHLGKVALPVVAILTGLTAATAAWGAIAGHAKEMADALERAEKAQRGIRDSVQDESGKLYDELAAAGVSMGPDQLDAALQRIQQGGRNPIRPMKLQFLRSREVVRALADKYGIDTSERDIDLALAVNGGKGPDATDAATLAQFLAGAQQPGADTAYDNFAAAHREEAFREGLIGAPFDRAQARKDSLLDSLKRQGYSDEAIKIISNLVNDPKAMQQAVRDRQRLLHPGGPEGDSAFGNPSENDLHNLGIAESILSAMNLASERVPGGGSVNINITNNKNETNVGTVFQNRNDPRNVPTLDLASNGTAGGGMHEQ